MCGPRYRLKYNRYRPNKRSDVEGEKAHDIFKRFHRVINPSDSIRLETTYCSNLIKFNRAYIFVPRNWIFIIRASWTAKLCPIALEFTPQTFHHRHQYRDVPTSSTVVRLLRYETFWPFRRLDFVIFSRYSSTKISSQFSTSIHESLGPEERGNLPRVPDKNVMKVRHFLQICKKAQVHKFQSKPFPHNSIYHFVNKKKCLLKIKFSKCLQKRFTKFFYPLLSH